MGALPILAIVVAGLLVVAAWFLRRKARGPAERDPADRLDTVVGWPPSATRVLGKGEILAYKVLVRALPGHMILAKVPLARFLDVPSRHSYAEWLRRLGYQCADLVVCDMAAEVVAVVNVRRSAGESSERAIKRHKRMAKVLKKAGVALFDWVDDALPTPERARAMLLPGATEPVEATPTVPGEDASAAIGDGPREPPPSTWFDEFNSGPAPLQPDRRASVVSSATPVRTLSR
jgi:hypothetical protein